MVNGKVGAVRGTAQQTVCDRSDICSGNAEVDGAAVIIPIAISSLGETLSIYVVADLGYEGALKIRLDLRPDLAIALRKGQTKGSLIGEICPNKEVARGKVTAPVNAFFPDLALTAYSKGALARDAIRRCEAERVVDGVVTGPSWLQFTESVPLAG